MAEVQSGEPPTTALTQRYRAAGAYGDCYFTDVERAVSLAEFVVAFYTSWLFRLERWILRLVSRPSTDDEARQLALGEREHFAAWSVEARAPDQLLLEDFTGRTLSWLMVAPVAGASSTRLYFGSVIVPVRDARTGVVSLGPVHGRLIGFHKFYSRMLLGAAARRVGVR